MGAEGYSNGRCLAFPAATAKSGSHDLAPSLKKISLLYRTFSPIATVISPSFTFSEFHTRMKSFPLQISAILPPFPPALPPLFFCAILFSKGGLPMKKPVRLFLALLLLVPLLPLTAAANSAEPPCFTILVVDPLRSWSFPSSFLMPAVKGSYSTVTAKGGRDITAFITPTASPGNGRESPPPTSPFRSPGRMAPSSSPCRVNCWPHGITTS